MYNILNLTSAIHNQNKQIPFTIFSNYVEIPNNIIFIKLDYE